MADTTPQMNLDELLAPRDLAAVAEYKMGEVPTKIEEAGARTIGLIALQQEMFDFFEARILSNVEEMRLLGATWGEIGQLLGYTNSSGAFKRFAPRIPGTAPHTALLNEEDPMVTKTLRLSELKALIAQSQNQPEVESAPVQAEAPPRRPPIGSVNGLT